MGTKKRSRQNIFNHSSWYLITRKQGTLLGRRVPGCFVIPKGTDRGFQVYADAVLQ
jgi:hypothetical protein